MSNYYPFPSAQPVLIQPMMPRQPMANLSVAYPQASRPSIAIPSNDTVETTLKPSQGLWHGLKYGALYGTIASAPLWGFEKMIKAENLLITSLKSYTFIPPETLKALIAKAERPLTNFLISAGSTIMIGLTAGAMLGAWQVKHTKEKIKKINEAKQEQQQGTFTVQQPNLLQQWGLKDKPIQNPEQAYQQMLQEELNPHEAFKYGAKVVLLQKGLLTLATTLLTVAGAALIKREMLARTLGIEKTPFIKQITHPVLLAKLAALPFIGGFIAKQQAPWIKEQLNAP